VSSNDLCQGCKYPSRCEALERQLAEVHSDVCENGHTNHAHCTDACACVGSGRSNLERLQAEVERLRGDMSQIMLDLTAAFPLSTFDPVCVVAGVSQAIAGNLLATAALTIERAAHAATKAAFAEFVDWHGAVHVGDCPGDDTCSCAGRPVNDAVNAALAGYQQVRS
jgi:hypothetical protein